MDNSIVNGPQFPPLKSRRDSAWSLPNLFFKVVSCKDGVMSQCPNKDIDFWEAFDPPDFFPQSWVGKSIRDNIDKIVTLGNSVQSGLRSPSHEVFLS
jgi:hypothetical protein